MSSPGENVVGVSEGPDCSQLTNWCPSLVGISEVTETSVPLRQSVEVGASDPPSVS